MTTKLDIQGITSYYGSQKVLDQVTFQVPSNKITTIIGPSGCGKTTLLMILSGLATENSNFSMEGRFLYKDKAYSQDNLTEIIGSFGMVFQQPLTFPLSIEKNMLFASRYSGKSKKESLAIAREKLQEVNLWDEVKDKLRMKATKLSGGQQQRLCIARSLTMYPDVLLMDEPCSALDAKNTAIIEDMLTELKNNYTIVFVTHNLAQARRISDGIVFINEGRVVEAGPASDLFLRPRHEETRLYINGEFG